MRALVASLGAVVLLAGCGGEASREDFQVEIVAARDRVDDALEQVTNATSAPDLIARLRIAATEVRSAADDVAEADAPDDLQDEERALANTLQAFAEELAATAVTLEELEGAAQEARGFDFDGWTETQKRLEELRRAGVQVPDLERH